MNDILTEGRNALQRILSLSAEVHQNMFLVQDAGFVTVALAWKGSFGAGKPWDSSALKASIGRSMSPDAPDFYCSSSTGAVLIEQLACAFRWLAGDVRHRCAWGQIDYKEAHCSVMKRSAPMLRGTTGDTTCSWTTLS